MSTDDEWEDDRVEVQPPAAQLRGPEADRFRTWFHEYFSPDEMATFGPHTIVVAKIAAYRERYEPPWGDVVDIFFRAMRLPIRLEPKGHEAFFEFVATRPHIRKLGPFEEFDPSEE